MKLNIRCMALVVACIILGFCLAHIEFTSVEAGTMPVVALAQTVGLGQVDVTDPEAIAFVNAGIRPVSERLRAIYYELKSLKAQAVEGGLLSKIPVDGGVIQDGREGDGVSRLTCNDVRRITTFANTFIVAYEDAAAGVGAMQKPCVRSLTVL